MKNITLTVDDETYRAARIRAAEENTSVSGLVKRLLREHSAGRPELQMNSVLELAAELRALTAGRSHTPAETLQQEGRNDR